VRFTIAPPDKTAFVPFDMPAVSPDGKRIVFVAAPAGGGRAQLWMRSLDSLSVQPLPGTEGGYLPFWSPDARAIGFFDGSALKKIEVGGGAAQTLCAISEAGAGAWNRHGEILFAGSVGPILRVSAGGGEPKPATTLDKSRQDVRHMGPGFLPDGRHFLFRARGLQPAGAAVFVASLDGPEVQQVVSADSAAVYAPPGQLLYVRGGTLMAQPFDAERRRLSGDASAVAEQIAPFATDWHAFSVSGSRVLAYRTGTTLTQSQLAWFDRTGRRLGTPGEPADYTNPALSHDGKRVAVGRRDPKTMTRDIWLFEVERETASRVTFDPADDLNPVFSPDGARILFTSDRKGNRDIYWKAATGVGEDEPVLETETARARTTGRRTVGSSSTTPEASPHPAGPISGWHRSKATASRSPSWYARSLTRAPRSRATGASSPTCPTSPAGLRST